MSSQMARVRTRPRLPDIPSGKFRRYSQRRSPVTASSAWIVFPQFGRKRMPSRTSGAGWLRVPSSIPQTQASSRRWTFPVLIWLSGL